MESIANYWWLWLTALIIFGFLFLLNGAKRDNRISEEKVAAAPRFMIKTKDDYKKDLAKRIKAAKKIGWISYVIYGLIFYSSVALFVLSIIFLIN